MAIGKLATVFFAGYYLNKQCLILVIPLLLSLVALWSDFIFRNGFETQHEGGRIGFQLKMLKSGDTKPGDAE